MSKFKDMKFLVANEKQSGELQKVLFSLGYAWNFGEHTVQHTEEPHIYANAPGRSVCFGDCPDFFYNDETHENHEWMDTAKFIEFHNRPKTLDTAWDDYESFKPSVGRPLNHLKKVEQMIAAQPKRGRTINMTEAINIAKAATDVVTTYNPNSFTEVVIMPETLTFVEKPARNKYMREIKPGVWVDVYDVIRAFNVTDGALQHLLKKALAVGQRGHKDAVTDYKDIVASSKRALEIYEEWNNKI